MMVRRMGELQCENLAEIRFCTLETFFSVRCALLSIAFFFPPGIETEYKCKQ